MIVLFFKYCSYSFKISTYDVCHSFSQERLSMIAYLSPGLKIVLSEDAVMHLNKSINTLILIRFQQPMEILLDQIHYYYEKNTEHSSIIRVPR